MSKTSEKKSRTSEKEVTISIKRENKWQTCEKKV